MRYFGKRKYEGLKKRECMNLQRLDKIIATQLNISRKDAKAEIRRGNVSVEGKAVKDPSFSVDPHRAAILFKGQAVVFKEHIYIIMNKPKGVLSASTDKNRKTVVDLIPESLRRPEISPVGRLDKDTTGLLLLTDDGAFAHRVISPKSGIKKLYEAVLDGELPANAKEKFSQGIVLADGTKCLPAGIEAVSSHTALVEISEGKYHQIKRMFGVLGLGVTELKRLKIGNLCLPIELSQGECRELTCQERELVLG